MKWNFKYWLLDISKKKKNIKKIKFIIKKELSVLWYNQCIIRIILFLNVSIWAWNKILWCVWVCVCVFKSQKYNFAQEKVTVVNKSSIFFKKKRERKKRNTLLDDFDYLNFILPIKSLFKGGRT